MSSTQAEARRVPPLYRKLLIRVLILLIAANCIGLILHYSQRFTQLPGQQAGFARGMLHGALMPLALPNLLVGQDVEIYAARNTGRTYKLGYAVGVDVCGAIFFGFFFWRVSRWRNERQPG
jgi:hypothetical protein